MFAAQILRVVYNILKVRICTVAYAGITINPLKEVTKVNRIGNVSVTIIFQCRVQFGIRLAGSFISAAVGLVLNRANPAAVYLMVSLIVKVCSLNLCVKIVVTCYSAAKCSGVLVRICFCFKCCSDICNVADYIHPVT